MSEGFESNIIIRLVPKPDGTHVMSFERAYDKKAFDIPLLRWPDRVTEFKKQVPVLLDPLRSLIGRPRLDEGEVTQAWMCAERFAYGTLRWLLDGTGTSAAEIMPRLAAHLAPVFLRRDSRPIFEVEAASTDELAWQMPFEFLPVAPPANPIVTARDRFEQSLGFRAEIVRFLRGGPQLIEIDSNGRLPLQLFSHPDERYSGIQDQVRFFRANPINLSVWPENVPDQFTAIIQLAERLLKLPPPQEDAIRGIAHFSCHYSAAGADAHGRYVAQSGFDFGVCNDGTALVIPIFDLGGELERQTVGRGPTPIGALVFLNACETGALGERGENLLGLFRSRNATAIIGSETLLPDPLAGWFAIHFYYKLMRGTPISTALVDARRELLNKISNPIGLFYTLYGNPLLRVKGPLENIHRPVANFMPSPDQQPSSRPFGWIGKVFRGLRTD